MQSNETESRDVLDDAPIFTIPAGTGERWLRSDRARLASLMTPDQGRYLVDLYYQIQEFRKALGNQRGTLEKAHEPHQVLDWGFGEMGYLEVRIRQLMETYTDVEPTGMGRWAKGQVGVGPVLSAGLLIYIDITQAPTVGHIWRLFGLDPTRVWHSRKDADRIVAETMDGNRYVDADQLAEIGRRADRNVMFLEKWGAVYSKSPTGRLTPDAVAKAVARRPFNMSAKVLCYKLGESFVKVSNNPDAFFGHIYKERKCLEQERNLEGRFAAQAAEILRTKTIGKDTEAYKWYADGKLPPAHIHARARRVAVKIFLSCWHEEAYRRYYHREPPLPYPLAKLPGHTHKISAPEA